MLAKLTPYFRIIFGSLLAIALIGFYFLSGSEEERSLIRKLENGGRDEKLIAMSTIRDTRQSNKKIVRILRHQMVNSDPDIRLAATQTLTTINHDEAVDALTGELNAGDPSIRLEAAETLERMGTSGARAALSDFTEVATEYSNKAAIEQISRQARKDRAREQKRAYREHISTYGN